MSRVLTPIALNSLQLEKPKTLNTKKKYLKILVSWTTPIVIVLD